MGFDFSTKVQPSKDTGTGWALNNEPIANVFSINFRTFLSNKKPNWLKVQGIIKPLKLEEYLKDCSKFDINYIEE